MAEPYAPGSKEWWLVRQVANGDERRSWYELTDEDRAALVAKPPPMPVAHMEEARERLERRLCGVTAPVVYVSTELLRTILAELDRRSPPTREGAWVLVPREPTEAMLDQGVAVMEQPGKDSPWHVWAAMLAAAPRPPDVSRGLDREEVARLIDPSSWAVMDGYLEQMKRQYKGENAGYDPDAFKHKASLAKADAIIALPAQPQETHDLGPANTLQGAQGAPAGSAPADTGRGE